MEMINTIFFSKDNAQAVRMFLQSINNFCPNVFNITVIYSPSNEEFEKGYEKLRQENIITDVKWIQQSDFKNNVLQILQTNAAYSCFFSDGDIIYDKFEENSIINILNKNQDVFCFSLRLGMNTKFCSRLNTPNNLYGEEHIFNVIEWDWTKNYLDFGFPISINSHIFRTKEIMKLTRQVSFKNSDELEEALQIFETFPRFKMAAFDKSVCVNITSNIKNKDLNEKYLFGEVIDVEKIELGDLDRCSKSIEYNYKTLQTA